jgi:hypothetical protein
MKEQNLEIAETVADFTPDEISRITAGSHISNFAIVIYTHCVRM